MSYPIYNVLEIPWLWIRNSLAKHDHSSTRCREVQRPTEGWLTRPNRDRQSHKMGRTGLSPTSVRSASGLRSLTEGQNPPFPKYRRERERDFASQSLESRRIPAFAAFPSLVAAFGGFEIRSSLGPKSSLP